MPPRALRWQRYVLLSAAGVAGVFVLVVGFFFFQYSREIEERLHGERYRLVPRVFARPLTLEAGLPVTMNEIIERLNDAGYTQRTRVERPGEFAIEKNVLALIPRGGDRTGQPVQATFASRSTRRGAPEGFYRITRLVASGKPTPTVTLDPPLVTALIGSREKRRRVPLSTIPPRVQQAVLAIEDRRFYAHPGVDPIRMVGALITNVVGDRPYLVGASTITQQLSRSFFLSEAMAEEQQTRQRSLVRKLQEQLMAVILESKATKDEILELYLNEVYLGNRGSFALHGVAEAARIFFAKDVSNLSLGEAALIAGVIQSPSNHSPFAHPDRSKDRRNVVLRAMAEANYITTEAADRATSEPVVVASRGIENEAPYFVDYLPQALEAVAPGVAAKAGALDIHTSLDLSLQRYAQDAVRDGLLKIDGILAKRRRGPPRVAQAALVAVEPRTGEIVAMIGGRSYNQSQFNRAINARRQPGSTFKPFVYLTAFERAAEYAIDLTPASIVRDEPTTWTVNNEEWSPHNFDEEYEGDTTVRHAFTMSRNIAAIKVAEQAGFGRVAALWKRTKVGETELRGYPSIALGVFELTPLEMAQAFTLFTNGGTIQPLTAISRVVIGNDVVNPIMESGPRVARATSAYLVTDMMRGVLNEGTGYGARAAGFTLDAAGKTGTTNDLRDAWFVGFTPELLTVVWVGLDDNQPLGLSGSQAALPIWASFMMKALAGHPNFSFHVPEGLRFAQIDRDTGMLAHSSCPRVSWVAFVAGTEPYEECDLH
ncbi:MAG: PBP1A family penicillin-binding protein [Vicinamibacterales bacterium]